MRTVLGVTGRTAGLLSLVCGSGCIPVQRPATPCLATRVIDAESREPIAGVRVSTWTAEDPTLQGTATTDAQGLVSVRTLKRTVWLPPLPIDPACLKGYVAFNAAGYQPRTLRAEEVLRAWTAHRQPVELTRTGP